MVNLIEDTRSEILIEVPNPTLLFCATCQIKKDQTPALFNQIIKLSLDQSLKLSMNIITLDEDMEEDNLFSVIRKSTNIDSMEFKLVLDNTLEIIRSDQPPTVDLISDILKIAVVDKTKFEAYPYWEVNEEFSINRPIELAIKFYSQSFDDFFLVVFMIAIKTRGTSLIYNMNEALAVVDPSIDLVCFNGLNNIFRALLEDNKDGLIEIERIKNEIKYYKYVQSFSVDSVANDLVSALGDSNLYIASDKSFEMFSTTPFGIYFTNLCKDLDYPLNDQIIINFPLILFGCFYFFLNSIMRETIDRNKILCINMIRMQKTIFSLKFYELYWGSFIKESKNLISNIRALKLDQSILFKLFDSEELYNDLQLFGQYRTYPTVSDYPNEFQIPSPLTLYSYLDYTKKFMSDTISKMCENLKGSLDNLNETYRNFQDDISKEKTDRLKWLFIIIPIFQLIITILIEILKYAISAIL